MSLKYNSLKLALVLALSLVGPAACNTQKAEQVEEEETTEAQADTSANRDNRSSQSGDAAFIKIFPDGEVVPTEGESATVSVPADAAAPAQENSSPAEAPAAGSSEAAAPGSTAEENSAPAPDEPAASADTGSQPSPEPSPEPAVVINEPAPAPVASEEPGTAKESDDTSRPVLTLNESTASNIISVLPKQNKAIVTIGKHSDFSPGPYMMFAKWTNDSKKVKVNVANIEAKEKNCDVEDYASQGDWKPLGVFYLTKKAKVVITNGKNSNFAVKNELMLKPVIADHLNSPTKFKCLGGQIKGQGLIAFP